MTTYKEPWKAAALNVFLPGAGHAYAQQWKMGLGLYLLLFILVLTIRFLAFSFAVLAGIITLSFFLYIFIIINGYRAIDKDKIYPIQKFDKWYFYILGFLGLSVLFNYFIAENVVKNGLIEFVVIPTPAMDPALQIGDYAAFEKSKNISRNDVIIFKYPQDPTTLFTKRCVGLPGDSFKIANKSVFVNGKPLASVSELRFNYFIKPNNIALSEKFFKENDIQDYMATADDSYAAYLTAENVKKLKTSKLVTNLTPIIETENEGNPNVYPNDTSLGWNMDFYGPLYIPKKGDKINLTKSNLVLYGKYILAENTNLLLKDTVLSRNGAALTNYQFKENYYFVMGDSRHNSLDSRFWGFVPEKLLVGKGLYLYWSKGNGRIGKEII